MKRLLVIAVCWSSLAAARGVDEKEARIAVVQFLTGDIGLNQAINRIAFLGAQRFAAHELVAALPRVDERKRPQVYEALALIVMPPPDLEVELALLRAASSDQVAMKIAAARGLARMRSARAYPVLLAMLKDELPAFRRAGAAALGDLAAVQAGPALAAALKVEDDLEARLFILVALGKVGDRRQAPALEASLTQSSEATRLAAAQALCQLGAPKGFAFAKQLLASTDHLERVQGVKLFEGVSAKLAAPALTPALADPDHRVRAVAARVLAQGGDTSKIDWLVLESSKSVGENRLPYEVELETLRLSDEDRRRILKRAGVQ